MEEEHPKIEGYQILGTLGEGGMGCVYKAKQISMDRFVAIKIVQNSQDEKFLKRFSHEAKAVAALNHPNIVKAIDHGQNEKVHYFVMEYIDGISLFKKITKYGRILEREALDLALQAANALLHAYKNKIIHRDIKPENILINAEGRVFLCDLGLAKSATSRSTHQGEVLGTPHYMSPEQCRGQKEVDTRSDIYSLGITLYHMITGEVPFDAPHIAAVCMKHVSEPMPDPRQKVIGLSAETIALIEKMTVKNPDDRFQDPEELIRAIKDILQGKKISFTSAKTVKIAPVSKVAPSIPKTSKLASSTHKVPVKTKRIARNRSMRTSGIQSVKTKSSSNNYNVMILVIICVMAAIILLLVSRTETPVDDQQEYSYREEIKSLLQSQKISAALGKIEEYKSNPSYQQDAETQNIEKEIILYYRLKGEIEKSAGQLDFVTAFQSIVDLKKLLPQQPFSSGTQQIEKNIQEIEKLKFETLTRDIANNIDKIKAFKSINYQEKLGKIISQHEDRLVQKNSYDDKQNETDQKLENKIPEEKDPIDPAIENFSATLQKATLQITEKKIIEGIQTAEHALSLLDKKKYDITLIRFPAAKDVTKFEEALADMWSKLLVLDENAFISSLNQISKALHVYFSLETLVRAQMIEKPDLIGALDSFWETQWAKWKKNEVSLDIYQAFFAFIEKEFTELEKLQADYGKNLLLTAYRDISEKIDKVISKGQLSFEEYETVISIYVSSFQKKASLIAKVKEAKEIQNELRDNIGTKLQVKIENAVEKEINNTENIRKIQEVCAKIASIMEGDFKKFYDQKRNEARILELILGNKRKKECFYNFEKEDRVELAKDWQLVSLSGKKRNENILNDNFIEVPVNSILFWKYPVTNNFKIEIRAFNPNNNNVKRNSKLVRWPEHFGVVAFRDTEASLLFLYNYRRHLNMAVKFKPKEEGYNRFSLPLVQTPKDFPYNDRQPAAFLFTTQVQPLAIRIQGKDVDAEEQGELLPGKFFIGIINIPTNKDSSLAVQQIRINNMDFYTNDYLSERELSLTSKD